jgi:SAM-dependent methyltransferase
MILRHLDRKPNLIGLDYSQGEIAVAERRGVYSRAICSGSDEMPIEDASLDFVFSNSVLEHIPALDETIAEVARVLKTGGALIATVPAPAFRELLGAGSRTGQSRQSYFDRMDARLGHHNYLDEEAWRTLCARHGLQLDLAKPYLDRAQLRRWERLSAMTGGALQALGASNAMLYRLQRLTRSDDRTAGGLLVDESQPAAWCRLWARVVAGSVLRESGKLGKEGACLLLRAIKS